MFTCNMYFAWILRYTHIDGQIRTASLYDPDAIFNLEKNAIFTLEERNIRPRAGRNIQPKEQPKEQHNIQPKEEGCMPITVLAVCS